MPSEAYPLALFRLPFRPLFLGAGVFALLAMWAWGWFWFSPWPFTPLGGISWWHAHEMVFGFSGAVLVGFLLTAARTWTGLPGMGGIALILLTLCWVAARLGIALGTSIWQPAILLATAAFWLIASARFGYMILKVKMWRNLVLVPVVLLMATMDLVSVRMATEGSESLRLLHAGVLLMLVALTIVGGRVLPFFTSTATDSPMVSPASWIEWPLLLLTLVVFTWNLLNGLSAQSRWLAVLLAFLGLIHLCRFLRWEYIKGFSSPMLWSLHLAYLFLVLGIFLLASYHAGWLDDLSTGMHAITVGAIGGMILSMTARVSLGHTGRRIEATRSLVVAFSLIFVAAAVRSIGPLFLAPEYWTAIYQVSACLWCFAWVAWLWQFAPVLISPRADGRPG